jgi:porin
MRALTATLTAVIIWTSPAAADDWLQPVVDLQQSLAELGIALGGGVTGFGQGLVAGNGSRGVQFGGKTDILLGLDGGKLGLWQGLSISAHFEQDFGQSANQRSHGAILPVNTALGFPTLGGTNTDLSLIVTQKFGDAVSISLGKFNMLDVAARTPLMGGGGETGSTHSGKASQRRHP